MGTIVPRVVALIAAFNEADIIGPVVDHLIDQRVEVYLIDDGSTDGTAEVVAHRRGQGLIAIERRERQNVFDWTALLRRKEELAATLDADWFMHQDADEFRESPWPGLTIAEAFRELEARGYNAVDFAVLNFLPTTADPAAGDVRMRLLYYEPAGTWDRVQVKAWRKTDKVDLVSHGGHDAVFDGRRVCPLRFLARHYPVRSLEHAKRKIFEERKPRFASAERARGWHVQYDAVGAAPDMLRDPAGLRLFEPSSVRIDLLLSNRDAEEAVAARVRAERALEQATRELESERLARQGLEEQLSGAPGDLLRRSGAAVDWQARCAALQAEALQWQEAAEEARASLAAATRAAGERAIRRELTLEALRANLRGHAAALAACNAELDALQRSASWRVTAPLRRAFEVALGALHAVRGDRQ